MHSTITPATPASGTFLTLLYILLVVAALVGTTGLYGLWRYAKKQGVRDERMDRTADVVLGTKHAPSLSRRTDDLARQAESHSRALTRIEAKISANGGDTHHVGDIAQRVEIAVREIGATLRGVGERLAAHEAVDEHVQGEIVDRLAKLEKKP